MTMSSLAVPRPLNADADLQDLAEKLLERSGYSTLRRLRCDAANGIVSVRGCVPSFHLKQLAQAILMRAEPVLRVNNFVEVKPIEELKASDA